MKEMSQSGLEPAAGAKMWSETKIDRAIAFALFFGTVILLAWTSDAIGFTRDEGYYFKAGEKYFGWFRFLGESIVAGDWLAPFQASVLEKHLAYNWEHPVLLKNLFALSWGILKESFGLFAHHSAAFRFPAWLFAGLSVSFLYLLSRHLLPRRAAIFAALAWISMPRVFWHMHLACFDIGVCAAHLWLVWAYVKGRRSVSGAFWIGVAFGLAAAVKHNVLVTPAFFVLHWWLIEARPIRLERRGWRIPDLPLSFFSMALVGPLVFVLHWPYLWPDPIARIGRYLGFHLRHEHYPILYFQELLSSPPFPISFPFVMSAITIPVPLLVLFALGVLLGIFVWFQWWNLRRMGAAPDEFTMVPLGAPDREPSASIALLLLLQVAFPFVLIALPSSPIFGGTKHWMNALPFLCILGAWTLEEALQRLQRWMKRNSQAADEINRAHLWMKVGAAFCVILVLLPGALSNIRVHPYGLSSYNALVGYARGAANAGFQRTFWGYEPREVLPEVNEKTRRNARIHFGDTNYDDWRFYRRDGMLRKDIGFAKSVRAADLASVQPQGEFKSQWMDVRNEWQVDGPDRVVHIEGVPLSTLNWKP